MAAMTSSAATALRMGLPNVVRIASPSPCRLTTPRRALISCKIIVATMANTNVQSNAYPYPAPATLAVVTVPGPINAAATSSPGPRFLSLRTSLVMFPFPSVC